MYLIVVFDRKSRSMFPIDYIPINDKLRADATQASADLNHDLVAGD